MEVENNAVGGSQEGTAEESSPPEGEASLHVLGPKSEKPDCQVIASPKTFSLFSHPSLPISLSQREWNLKKPAWGGNDEKYRSQ